MFVPDHMIRSALALEMSVRPLPARHSARQEALAERHEQARVAGRPTAAVGGPAGYDRLGYDHASGTGSVGDLADLDRGAGSFGGAVS